MMWDSTANDPAEPLRVYQRNRLDYFVLQEALVLGADQVSSSGGSAMRAVDSGRTKFQLSNGCCTMCNVLSAITESPDVKMSVGHSVIWWSKTSTLHIVQQPYDS